MKDNEFDILIENTLNEYGDRYFDEPADTGHSFTPEFDRRIKSLSKPEKKKKPTLILRIAAAAGAVAAVAVIGVAALGVVKNVLPAMQGIGTTSYSTAAKNETAEPTDNAEGNAAASESSERAAITDEYEEPAPENNAAADNTQEGRADEKSLNNTAAEISGNTKTASSSNCSVTVKISGNIISLSQEKTDELTSAVHRLISDEALSVDMIFTENELNLIESRGEFISIRSESGENLVLDGEETPYSSITLFIDNGHGYAIAEGAGAYMCFAVEAQGEAYELLNEIAEG